MRCTNQPTKKKKKKKKKRQAQRQECGKEKLLTSVRVLEQVFLNIVLDEAVEEKDGGEKIRLGMVVRVPWTLLPSFKYGSGTDRQYRLFAATLSSCSRRSRGLAVTIITSSSDRILGRK